MPRYWYGIVVTCLALVRCYGQEPPPWPHDVSPVIGLAVAGDPPQEAAAEEWTVQLALPTTSWRVVGEVVPKTEWPELRADVQKSVLTLRLGGPSQLAPSRIVDLQGNDVDRARVVQRLAKETAVLVAVSGRMPDAYYLQVVKPETWVIILGPRDGAPAPQFLPAGPTAAGKRHSSDQ